MTLGIVTALAPEGRTLAGHDALLGQVGLRVEVAGPGAAQAAAAAMRLADGGCSLLVSWGLAGGLNPVLAPGRLVVARTVSGGTGSGWPCDPRWHATLMTALAPLAVVSGHIYSAPAPLTARSAKADLFAARALDAVDMESAAIAAVAEARGLAFAAVRSIVDPAGFSVPPAALAGMGGDGRTHPLGTLIALLRDPRQLVPLLRLARWYRLALGALVRAADALAAAKP
jgi:hopanoid-associated phosphorylase